jgi:hypothetical protein
MITHSIVQATQSTNQSINVSIMASVDPDGKEWTRVTMCIYPNPNPHHNMLESSRGPICPAGWYGQCRRQSDREIARGLIRKYSIQ